MRATVVLKDDEYVLNHCTKYLARDNTDGRHSYFGIYDGHRGAHISESWRFPIVDAHDLDSAAVGSTTPATDAYEYNDVTFVFAIDRNSDNSIAPLPTAVELVTTCLALNQPVALRRIAESLYWSITLKVPKAQRHRYVFLVDGIRTLDSINPQSQEMATGEIWSSFFTWAYNEPITFERWEFVLIDRLTRHILPFNDKEAKNFQQREATAGNTGHLYRLDVSVGVANYIDKILAREERHQLSHRRCGGLENAADGNAIGKHVIIVVLPLAGRSRERSTFEDQRRHGHSSSRSTSRWKPAGSRGGLSILDTLQDGHGMPAPPQPQAWSPSQGRSSCVSHTQKVSRQRMHFIASSLLGPAAPPP
jgi:hypothetical protein